MLPAPLCPYPEGHLCAQAKVTQGPLWGRKCGWVTSIIFALLEVLPRGEHNICCVLSPSFPSTITLSFTHREEEQRTRATLASVPPVLLHCITGVSSGLSTVPGERKLCEGRDHVPTSRWTEHVVHEEIWVEEVLHFGEKSRQNTEPQASLPELSAVPASLPLLPCLLPPIWTQISLIPLCLAGARSRTASQRRE